MVSPGQTLVRKAFKDCIHCFNSQPESGGVTPPDIGPRDRSWWYGQAGSMWYYNYFIQQSWYDFYSDVIPAWCRSANEWVGSAWGYSAKGSTFKYNWPASSGQIGVSQNHYPGGNYTERTVWSCAFGDITQEDIDKCSDIFWVVTFYREKFVLPDKNNYPLTVYFYYDSNNNGVIPPDWDSAPTGYVGDTHTFPVLPVATFITHQFSLKIPIADAISKGHTAITVCTTSDWENDTDPMNRVYGYGVGSGIGKPYLFIKW